MATESYFDPSCKRGNHELCDVKPTFGCACTCHVHEDYMILTEQGIWHIAIGRYAGTLVEAIDKYVDVAMREDHVTGVIDAMENLDAVQDTLHKTIEEGRTRLTGLEEALVRLADAHKAVDESRGA